jgi:peptidoglycan/LPS O-acetylase OafA/YrhL
MKGYLKIRCLIAGMCLTALAWNANAQEGAVDLAFPSHAYTKDAQSILLAANDTPQEKSAKKTAPIAINTDFQESWFTGAKVHQYLGLATIVAAVATAASAPGEGCEKNCTGPLPPRDTTGRHAKLAQATVNLAAATIITGLIYHWNDFSTEDGWTDPDNMHVMLGVGGALAMAYAVQKSRQSDVQVSHAGTAELGALAMAVGIRLTW